MKLTDEEIMDALRANLDSRAFEEVVSETLRTCWIVNAERIAPRGGGGVVNQNVLLSVTSTAMAHLVAETAINTTGHFLSVLREYAESTPEQRAALYEEAKADLAARGISLDDEEAA